MIDLKQSFLLHSLIVGALFLSAYIIIKICKTFIKQPSIDYINDFIFNIPINTILISSVVFTFGICYGADKMNSSLLAIAQFIIFISFSNFIIPLSLILGQLIGSIFMKQIFYIILSVTDLCEILCIYWVMNKFNINKYLMDIRFALSFFVLILFIFIFMLQLYSNQFFLINISNFNLPISMNSENSITDVIQSVLFSRFKDFRIHNFSSIYNMSYQLIQITLLKVIVVNISLLRWSFFKNFKLFEEHMKIIYYILLSITGVIFCLSMYYQLFFICLASFNIIVFLSSCFFLFMIYEVYRSNNFLYLLVIIGIWDINPFVSFFILVSVSGILYPLINFIKK